MIAKLGFIILILMSICLLYTLDYFIKQDQEENTVQMHHFLKQTHDTAQAKLDMINKVKTKLLIDLDRCEKIASNTNADYLLLIQKYVPTRHGKLELDSKLVDDAASLLYKQRAECKEIYDLKLQEVN
jgi:hypothetical protein